MNAMVGHTQGRAAASGEHHREVSAPLRPKRVAPNRGRGLRVLALVGALMEPAGYVGAGAALSGCATTAPDGRALVVADPAACGMGWGSCMATQIAQCGQPPTEASAGEFVAYGACVSAAPLTCHIQLADTLCARVPEHD